MRRFVVALIVGALAFVAGCTEEPKSPPVREPSVAPDQGLYAWQPTVGAFATKWKDLLAADNFPAEQIQVDVLAVTQPRRDGQKVCLGPQFDYASQQLHYCVAHLQPVRTLPPVTGVIFVPEAQFGPAVDAAVNAVGKEKAYRRVVVALALVYALHLEVELVRLAVTPESALFRLDQRVCLAGVSAHGAGIQLSAADATEALDWAAPFIQNLDGPAQYAGSLKRGYDAPNDWRKCLASA